MNISKYFTTVILLTAGSAFAQGEAAAPAEPQPAPSRWSLRAGYAWRTPADTKFAASAARDALPGGASLNGAVLGDLTGSQDWTFSGTFDEGLYSDPNYNEPLYSMALERRESIGGGSDEKSASGLNLAAGFDFWQNEALAVGLQARFAGYWDIGNSAWGGYHQYFDHYSFGFPTPEMGIGTPLEGVDTAEYQGRTYGFGGQNPRMSLKTDLYQIALGPIVTWHVLKCLDIYGGAEAICTFAKSDFAAGAASVDEVNCLWGVGGLIGFTGWMTDNLGFYGQVGYEWIDEDELQVMGCRAKTDYSSLVLSTGLQLRF